MLRTPARRLAAVAVLGLCVAYAVLAPGRADERFVDQTINRETVEAMREGAGYYPAMDRALRDNGGPVSSVRAFRPPAPFLLWRLLPGPRAVWLVYVVAVAVAALLLLDITTAPLVVPLVAWYMLNVARPHLGGVWIDQLLVVELWVVPAVAAMLWAWKRKRFAWAAAFATAAVLFRELALGLLAGGLLASHVLRRPRRPWLIAIGVAVAAVALHAVLVSKYLVADGNEMALLGTGGPSRVASMMGAGIRFHPLVVGPLLWVLAAARVATDRELRLLLPLYLAIPLTGFFVGRDYWGFLLVAFTILWAGEALVALRSRRGSGTA